MLITQKMKWSTEDSFFLFFPERAKTCAVTVGSLGSLQCQGWLLFLDGVGGSSGHVGTSTRWCLGKMSVIQTCMKAVGRIEEMPVLTK